MIRVSSLIYLELTGNDISDITPLSGLPNLMQLDLRFNPELRDIQALLENPGVGQGDIVELRHTDVSCADQARLAERSSHGAVFFLRHGYETKIGM